MRPALLIALSVSAQGADTHRFPLDVLPSERRIVTDAVTSAELTFVNTDPEVDNNLHFHERSFLADDSLVLFTSRRKSGGLMGCIMATGEPVRFAVGGAQVLGRRWHPARRLPVVFSLTHR